ncbi:hypothetical protein [Micromonospora purpureochromogenes]|uniref:hypothetical protein n=1 Tax=Micromonospora purpureochromogenes TaxID=47872 RepID=UPI001E2AE078|nr:hypothetical protein [Micromonospora purpureochromogenes]
MNHRTTLFTLGLAGVLLVAGGCTGSAEPTRAEPTVRAGRATPSPTPDTARVELVEALQRSQGVAHRYAVRGDLPEGDRQGHRRLRPEGAPLPVDDRGHRREVPLGG